ncbi:MAG: hypothetical protein ACOCQB_01380 [Halanaerobiaceae bacterium]
MSEKNNSQKSKHHEQYNDFRQLLKQITTDKKQLTKKQILKEISRAYIEKYPAHKIWFAEKLGKRLSYITGNGREKFLSPEKIHISGNLFLLIQAEKPPPKKVKKTLIQITQSLIHHTTRDKNNSH